MINSSFQFDEGINSTHNNQQQKQNSQRFVKQLSFYSQSSTQTQKLNNSKEENNKKSQLQRQNTIQRVPIYHKNENQQFDLQTFCQQQKLQFQEQYLKNKTLDSSTSSLHNFFSTEEAIQMLEQPLDERRIKGLRQLRVYFQEYEFFQKLLVKEGQEFVNQCVDNLICKSFKCNNLMYNSSLGEIEPDVRGVMILIRGKSRVFYDRECALKYMLGQQCDYQSKSELVFEGFTLGGYEYEQDSVRQNQKKVYSIYCEENCQFAFLDKQSFSQIKLQKLRLEKRELIEFFKSISIFSNFEDMTLVEVILQCEKQYFNRMQYVYKDGDECDYIYFVQEGEFTLNQQRKASSNQEILEDEKKLDEQKSKLLNQIVPKQFILKEEKNKTPQQNEDDSSNTFHNKKIKDLYSQMLEKQKNRGNSKNIQITLVIYQSGTFFGDKEIIEDIKYQESTGSSKKKKRREFSVQCMSDQGICYKISYFKFRKLIQNHRQIFTHLMELNEQVNGWMTHRIEQIKYQKQLTNSVQIASKSQLLKQIKWKQEEDEVKAKLIEQHKAATQYLEQSLSQLQKRIKREDKERNLKVCTIAKEITRLRESRHQQLHSNLMEKKKKENLENIRYEQQSPQNIKKGSPRNIDSQLELNSPLQTFKKWNHHNENSQSNTTLKSKPEIQLAEIEENCSNPVKLSEKSVSVESNKQASSRSEIQIYKSSHALPKNNNEATKQIKFSQSTKNLKASNLSPIRAFFKANKNSSLKKPEDNYIQVKSHSQDKRMSLEYSQANQDQQDKKKQRVISFLKKDQEVNYLPQFFIKSSIPLQEYQLKNPQINVLSNSLNADLNQSKLTQRENQIFNSQETLIHMSKLNPLNLNETTNFNNSLITNTSYPKLFINQGKGNGFFTDKLLSPSSKKSPQSIIRFITQSHQKDDSFDLIPLKTCVTHNTSPLENIQNLAAANQNINCNKFQITAFDTNSFILKSRSITNSDQKSINFQSTLNDSLSPKNIDINKKMDSYLKMKDPSSIKLHKLPLKYFVNQYKIVQKQHLGMKNYNLKKLPSDQSSLKIISPRLQTNSN